MLEPVGGQERGYRRGTENLPAVLGMAAALEACAQPYMILSSLSRWIKSSQYCRENGGVWHSDSLSDPTPYVRAVAMPGMSRQRAVDAL